MTELDFLGLLKESAKIAKNARHASFDAVIGAALARLVGHDLKKDVAKIDAALIKYWEAEKVAKSAQRWEWLGLAKKLSIRLERDHSHEVEGVLAISDEGDAIQTLSALIVQMIGDKSQSALKEWLDPTPKTEPEAPAEPSAPTKKPAEPAGATKAPAIAADAIEDKSPAPARPLAATSSPAVKDETLTDTRIETLIENLERYKASSAMLTKLCIGIVKMIEDAASLDEILAACQAKRS